jgi:hypothetical protein
VGQQTPPFNLASRELLHKEGLGEAMLETAILAGKEEFLKRKKDQFEVYWAGKQNNPRLDK